MLGLLLIFLNFILIKTNPINHEDQSNTQSNNGIPVLASLYNVPARIQNEGKLYKTYHSPYILARELRLLVDVNSDETWVFAERVNRL